MSPRQPGSAFLSTDCWKEKRVSSGLLRTALYESHWARFPDMVLDIVKKEIREFRKSFSLLTKLSFQAYCLVKELKTAFRRQKLNANSLLFSSPLSPSPLSPSHSVLLSSFPVLIAQVLNLLKVLGRRFCTTERKDGTYNVEIHTRKKKYMRYMHTFNKVVLWQT